MLNKGIAPAPAMSSRVKDYCESVAKKEGLFNVYTVSEVYSTTYLCEQYNIKDGATYGHVWLTQADITAMIRASHNWDYVRVADAEPRHVYKDKEVKEPDYLAVYKRLSEEDKLMIDQFGTTSEGLSKILDDLDDAPYYF